MRQHRMGETEELSSEPPPRHSNGCPVFHIDVPPKTDIQKVVIRSLWIVPHSTIAEIDCPIVS